MQKNTVKVNCRSISTRGFTLVEMAVVVTIMGLLMAMGLSLASNVMKNTQRSVTKEKMAFVKDALVAYFFINKRFPCPDTGSNVGNTGRDGVENRTAGGANPTVTANCASFLGTVPYRTLGISRNQALDGYGNFITYRLNNVSNWHLSATFVVPCAIAGIANGPISVFSSAAAPAAETEANPAVLISHGFNGLGAWNTGPTNNSRNVLPAAAADEFGNTQLVPAAPAGYRNYVNSDAPGNPFDDVLQAMTIGELNTVATKLSKANICS